MNLLYFYRHFLQGPNMPSIKQLILIMVLFTSLGAVSAQTPQIIQLKQQAIQLEEAGDLAGAMAVNQRLLLLKPDDVAVMNTIAGLYGVQHQYQQEIEWADKALAIDTAYAPAHINRGNALAALGRIDEAKTAFQRVIQVAPDNPLGPYSLGVLAERQGQIESALAWCQQSIKIDPTFENGWFNAAAMYANLRRWGEATTALQKIAALNPEADDALRMLQIVQRMKAGPF